MLVTNTRHETAIVTRRDGETAVFVRFNPGKLACERLTEAQFREQWQEMNYPLNEALVRFIEHAQAHGATREALNGLRRLQARDIFVVASLF